MPPPIPEVRGRGLVSTIDLTGSTIDLTIQKHRLGNHVRNILNITPPPPAVSPELKSQPV
jgi:hypothetical protein